MTRYQVFIDDRPFASGESLAAVLAASSPLWRATDEIDANDGDAAVKKWIETHDYYDGAVLAVPVRNLSVGRSVPKRVTVAEKVDGLKALVTPVTPELSE